ncbi:MAG: PKD domain-containing protein [bacterium]
MARPNDSHDAGSDNGHGGDSQDADTHQDDSNGDNDAVTTFGHDFNNHGGNQGCTTKTATGTVHGANATLIVPAGACPCGSELLKLLPCRYDPTIRRPSLDRQRHRHLQPGNIPHQFCLPTWPATGRLTSTEALSRPHLNPSYGTANLIAYDYVEHKHCAPTPPTDVCPNIDGVQTTVPAGKHLASGQCVDDSSNTPTATIVATKIICDNESDLPNWGAGGPNVTASTANAFLALHSDCHEQSDWTFQWAPDGTANPGDQVEEGGAAWTPFEGTTTVPVGAKVWVREEFDADYIPFSGDTTDPRSDDVSAEFYCNNDVLNYDNYDFVNPIEAGHTYNCIGFNVLKEVEDDNNAPVADAGPDQIITLPANTVDLDASGSADSDGTIDSYVWTEVSGPSTVDPDDAVNPTITDLIEGTYVFELTVTDNDGATATDTVTITVNPIHNGGGNPQCSDGADNDGDGKIDILDPGCHTDGNPTHADTYNPNDNDETDVPQCSNTGDDDGDGKIDQADPGCHTDGNPDNEGSYVPTDNDETDDGQGGGGDDTYQCSDTVDNDGDNLIDILDPGCHSDGNADNAESYVSTDDDETNSTDNGGGSTHHGGSSHKSGGRPAGQVLAASNTCGIYVEKYLRVGYANDVLTVQKVQTFLNDYMNAGLVIDGVYGPQTEAAVRNFQAARNTNVLAPWGISDTTGIFYLTTQTEVNNIMCPTLNLPIPANLINFSQNPGVTPAPLPHVAASQKAPAPATVTPTHIPAPAANI